MSIDAVAQYLSDIWAGVETQAQVYELGRSFSFPSELHNAVRVAMELAAQQDAADRLERGVTIPADPCARGGKWYRAANIVDAWSEDYARANDLPLATGDWSALALLEVVGARPAR